MSMLRMIWNRLIIGGWFKTRSEFGFSIVQPDSFWKDRTSRSLCLAASTDFHISFCSPCLCYVGRVAQCRYLLLYYSLTCAFVLLKSDVLDARVRERPASLPPSTIARFSLKMAFLKNSLCWIPGGWGRRLLVGGRL
jgi:hypothetical protein